MASIKKRDNGKWRARYRDVEGKEHARHFSKKIEAQHWLDSVTASVVRGDYVDPRAGLITYREFYESWSTRQVWSRGTRASSDHVNKGTTFADVPLLKIKRSHVETWVKSMVSAGLAPQTISSRISLSRAVFSAAIGDQLIAVDPSRGVKGPRKRSAEFTMNIPSSGEVRRLLDNADPFFRVAIIIGAFAGLRQGEIAGLQLGDFDFLGRQLHVRRQVQRLSPHPSRSGHRSTIPSGISTCLRQCSPKCRSTYRSSAPMATISGSCSVKMVDRCGLGSSPIGSRSQPIGPVSTSPHTIFGTSSPRG